MKVLGKTLAPTLANHKLHDGTIASSSALYHSPLLEEAKGHTRRATSAWFWLMQGVAENSRIYHCKLFRWRGEFS